MKEIGVNEFYKLINDEEEGSRETQMTSEESEIMGNALGTLEVFIGYLKSISNSLGTNRLNIIPHGDRAPINNPNSSKVRPDIVIILKDSLDDIGDGEISWGLIEMPIEFHSTGKSYEQRVKQVLTYVTCLLEARPDLVSALGLLVESDCLVFLFCNADGIKKLSLSRKDNPLPFLTTIMKYLNTGQKKNCDSTLARRKEPGFFTLTVQSKLTSLGISECSQTTFPLCHLHYAEEPFDRRSTILIYKPEASATATRVIKDQYLKKEYRWTEKDILTKIHKDGAYPAVVRMLLFDQITKATCGDRIKVRMVMEDYGAEFLSLNTPRDAIYALYDLLEVTRSLYFDRKILHRDISPYNIMIRNSRYSNSIATCSKASPVFIRHLLDPDGVPKRETSIFLIDFGYSQDLDSSPSPHDGRTGTPIFIARAVQAGESLPSSDLMAFPALPQLCENLKAVYECAHPKRMELFNGPFVPQFGPSKNPPSSAPFKHELCHDGESGVWSFFWWSLLAFPANEEQDCIDGGTWGYNGLHKLFKDISAAILYDYHSAEDSIRREPDFVHEILQRIILNFVVENRNAPFMDKEKADSNRKVPKVSSASHLSTQEIASRRLSTLSPASGPSRKRKHSVTIEAIADPLNAIPFLKAAGESSKQRAGHRDDQGDEDTCRFEKKPRTDNVQDIHAGTK